MPVARQVPVQQVLAAECTLGEGPVWDAARGLVWFVDIKRHQLWRFDPASGAHATYAAPGQIGWALPASTGKLLCGLQDGLYLFDPAEPGFARLRAVPGEPGFNRLNDACSAPDGSAWFGSMDDGEEQATGRFYRFDRGVVVPAGMSDISITNGPAIDAAGSRIYMTDTLGKTIHVAELNADGSAGPARLFVDTALHFPEAYPDGPVVDSEGFVWTGLFCGGSVARFSPDGELVMKVAIPAANVTKLAFGGPDLKTAFVTTARKGLSEAELAEQPLAGSLFAFESEVAGILPAEVRLA